MLKFTHLNHHLRQSAGTGKTLLIKLDWYLEALDEALRLRTCWLLAYVCFRLILWLLMQTLEMHEAISVFYPPLRRESLQLVCFLRWSCSAYCMTQINRSGIQCNVSYPFFLHNCKEILIFECCLDSNACVHFDFITCETEENLLKLWSSLKLCKYIVNLVTTEPFVLVNGCWCCPRPPWIICIQAHCTVTCTCLYKWVNKLTKLWEVD